VSQTKQCNKCGHVKPLDQFYKHSECLYGREPQCKECRQKQQQRYNQYRRQQSLEEDMPKVKRCNNCGKIKSLDHFAKNMLGQYGRYSQCKECLRIKQRKRHAENPERQRKRQRQYYAKHPEKVRAWSRKARRKYYATHKEEEAARFRKWQLENPDKCRAYAANRRALKKQADGSFTTEEFDALCEKYANKCLCCGSTNEPLTVDHVIPLSEGGSNDISNIQPLCLSCNSRKQDKTIDYR